MLASMYAALKEDFFNSLVPFQTFRRYLVLFPSFSPLVFYISQNHCFSEIVISRYLCFLFEDSVLKILEEFFQLIIIDTKNELKRAYKCISGISWKRARIVVKQMTEQMRMIVENKRFSTQTSFVCHTDKSSYKHTLHERYDRGKRDWRCIEF